MPRRRVMIAGVSGTLGGYLARALANDATIVAAGMSERTTDLDGLGHVEWQSQALDATAPEALDSLIREAKPHTIINTVAITPKHQHAADGERMCLVNAKFPHRLAASCERAGVRLIHISSDAVFSGARGSYSESDTPDPVDAYGKTKLAGEVGGPGIATLRTTFFGLTPHRPGLLDWFLRQQAKRVHGYANYRFSGLSLGTLSATIDSLIRREEPLEGVFHVGGESVSKFELLGELNSRFRVGADLHADPLPVCATGHSIRWPSGTR